MRHFLIFLAPAFLSCSEFTPPQDIPQKGLQGVSLKLQEGDIYWITYSEEGSGAGWHSFQPKTGAVTTILERANNSNDAILFREGVGGDAWFVERRMPGNPLPDSAGIHDLWGRASLFNAKTGKRTAFIKWNSFNPWWMSLSGQQRIFSGWDDGSVITVEKKSDGTWTQARINPLQQEKTYDRHIAAHLPVGEDLYIISSGYDFASHQAKPAKLYRIRKGQVQGTWNIPECKNSYGTDLLQVGEKSFLLTCNPLWFGPSRVETVSLVRLSIDDQEPRFEVLEARNGEDIQRIELGALDSKTREVLVTEIAISIGQYAEVPQKSYWLNLEDLGKRDAFPFAKQAAYSPKFDTWLFSCYQKEKNSPCQQKHFGVLKDGAAKSIPVDVPGKFYHFERYVY